MCEAYGFPESRGTLCPRINPLNLYYKFSKSIVISVFDPFLLLLLSSQSLRRLCLTSRHLTLPFQPDRTDSVHMRPTPSLRGLNNLGNLRLYDIFFPLAIFSRPSLRLCNLAYRSVVHPEATPKMANRSKFFVLRSEFRVVGSFD